MAKITILVAVYNAEKYLHKCLDSLTNQTYDDIQIICIDDASTDSSLDIINDYAAKDKRIKVLHLDKNHGQAYARNEGLKVANGELITAVDADDWLAKDAIADAVQVFTDHPLTDSVLFDVQYIFPDGHSHGYCWNYPTDKYKSLKDGSFESMDGYGAFVASLSWQIHGWTIDKAKLFHEYPYDDTCRFYSDDNTAHLHFLASREVRCCKGKYYYRQNLMSTTHHIGVGRMDWMLAADSMRRQLETLKMPEAILCIWEWERWKIIIGCYWLYYVHREELSLQDRKYCIAQIRKSWEGVNIHRLKGKPLWKLGWYPCKGHWKLFQLEENLYFFLRWMIGR